MKAKNIKKIKKYFTYLKRNGVLKTSIDFDFKKLVRKKKLFRKRNKKLKKVLKLVPNNVNDDFTKKDRLLPFVG